MPRVHTNGVDIHFRDDDFTPPWQASEAVWIQHGYGRNADFWYAWVPALSPRYRVLRRDMRAHGDSSDPGPGVRWTLGDLLDDMVGFLDALGLERVHYVGESLGGMLGVALAATSPERFASLTLCAVPRAIHPRTQEIFALGYESWDAALEALGSGGWGRAMISLGGALDDADAAHVEWLVRQWSRTPTHALRGLARLAAAVDIDSLLPRVRVPTLVLAPSRSPFTRLEEQRAVHAALPDASLAIIESRGHEIYLERPDACTGALLEFLDALRVRRGHAP